LILELQMHDLVGVVLPLLEVEDLRLLSQVKLSHLSSIIMPAAKFGCIIL